MDTRNKNKKTFAPAVPALLLLLLLAPIAALGAGPRTITYQASISGADAAAGYDLQFTLYFDADGLVPAGWSETHLGVEAPGGVVTVQLGSLQPFPVDLFMSPMHLGVAINGDPEMLPRTPLTNTPYEIQLSDDLDLHINDGVAHAPKTVSFRELTDQVTVSQLPPEVTLDSELVASAATKADLNHSHADQAALIQSLADAVTALTARVATLEGQVVTLQQQVNDADAGVGAFAALFNVMEIDGSDVRFNGVNLYVTNGSGSADVHNGLGNLIIGYNLGDGGAQRSGSHNLVVGDNHSYSSHGGLVAGHDNGIHAPYASVLGGEFNQVTAAYGSVAGGRLNRVGGDYASVLGGEGNTADGPASAIAGGAQNAADGLYASVAGGTLNQSSGSYASVAGGSGNIASGESASISGGADRTVDKSTGESVDTTFGGALVRDGDTLLVSGVNLQLVNGSGVQSTVNGLGNLIVGYAPARPSNVRTGSHNLVLGSEHSYQSYGGLVSGRGNGINGPDAAVIGGRGTVASGIGSVGIGGKSNNLIGEHAVVVGGVSNSATGFEAVAVSGAGADAAGAASLIAGGADNRAFGTYAAVLGGAENQVFGDWSAVVGGRGGNASANYAMTAGGWLLRATQPYANVFGGYNNSAEANWAVTVGGQGNSASGLYTTVVGGNGVSYARQDGIAALEGVQRVGDTLVLSGMNVQIVNGSAATETDNGLGNLLIGYGYQDAPRARGGSHNLVVGDDHTYTSHAGIVAGRGNSIGAAGASVLGGQGNVATGSYSAILGGSRNSASGAHAAVSGGQWNSASGDQSSVGGGLQNQAGQQGSTIPAGRNVRSLGGL